MISSKRSLTGIINSKKTIRGNVNKGIQYVNPITQEKEVAPTKEVQTIKPDEGYTGLSKVIIDKISDDYIIPTGSIEIISNGIHNVTDKASAIVNVPEKQLGTKTITVNGIYKASDENLDGYSEVNVETSGVNIWDYFMEKSQKNKTFIHRIKDIPLLDTSNDTSMRYMFQNCSSLTTLDLSSFDTSNVTSMHEMFRGCSKLVNLNLSGFNFSKVSSYSSMFSGIPTDCYILVKDTTAKEWITSKFTNLTNVHYVGE